MEVEKKSNVSFGTTMSRPIYPMKVPPTRFGNKMTSIRGAPNRGPGAYDNDAFTNFWSTIEKKLVSTKGYTLGARTGPRMAKSHTLLTPAPAAYQTKCTDPKEFEEAYKPFSAASERFPVFKRDIEDVCPGPATYEHDVEGNRKVSWHASFGGCPINLPSVTQHSTIDQNTNKLLSTKEEKKYQRRLSYLKLYYD